jgi:hypothetical protein
MKHLLMKLNSYTEFQAALIHWRNMPRSTDDISPAEIFFGRRLRTAMPTIDSSIVPAINIQDRTLPPLQVGDNVRIQNYKTKRWDQKAIVLSIRPTQRSYSVMNNENSRIYLRNRRFLKLTDSDQQITNNIHNKFSDSKSGSKKHSTFEPRVTRSQTREKEREAEKKHVHFS